MIAEVIEATCKFPWLVTASIRKIYMTYQIKEVALMPQKNGSNETLDAQKSVEQTASIVEHLFRAPKPVILVAPILILSLFFGLFITLDPGKLYETLAIGLIIFALPAFVSALVSKPLAESLGGRLYLRRSMLLSFLALIIVGLIVGFFVLLKAVFDLNIALSVFLIFAYSAIFWLRHLILMTTSNSSHIRSLPASISQPITGMVVVALVYPPFGLNEMVLSIVFLLIFFLTLALYVTLASSPMKRSFNVDGLAMVRYSLDHITEGGREGSKGVEAFFESFSEEVDVHIGMIAFKKGERIKAILIVPCVHPGPFGSLGGSDLPIKLVEGMRDVCGNILVAHGAATHDFDLSSSKENEKVLKRAKELLKDIQYSDDSSKFMRVHDSMDVCAQMFGENALVLHTSSPNPTDDVDYSTGIALLDKVKGQDIKDSIFIDAHNCAKKGSGCIYYGTEESHRLIELATSAVEKSKQGRTSGINAGYAQKGGFERVKGIGACGIQALVLETGGQKSAYVLFDGNNMVPGLREGIIKAVQGMVDEVEVLTSDNHAVNATIGGFNPVGLRMDESELIRISKELVGEALKDLEGVNVGFATGLVKGIQVFGHENIARLTSTINATMAILKKGAFVSLLVAVLASTIVFLMLI